MNLHNWYTTGSVNLARLRDVYLIHSSVIKSRTIKRLIFLRMLSIHASRSFNGELSFTSLFKTIYSNLVNNYSLKWGWIMVDIYRDAKRRCKYSPLSPTLRWKMVWSIYHTDSKKLVHFIRYTEKFSEIKLLTRDFVSSAAEVNSNCFRTSRSSK